MIWKCKRWVLGQTDATNLVLGNMQLICSLLCFLVCYLCLLRQVLQDRRKVYDLLERSGIDVPRHAYVSRDGYKSTGTGDGNGNQETELQEFDDHIEINGVTIHKPFVEKPVDAEDHNIAIYYPTSAGGGCKKLFRKVGNRSSEFYPEINEVRREGSYIYEEFVETQGTDVKMYTVGPEYGQ